jgi:CheY-like chemotaxis protein
MRDASVIRISYHRRRAFPAGGADPVRVARILICEPHADIRALLEFVVLRLGHEAAVADGSREQLLEADALVLEPGDGDALALASWAREHLPGLALVCTSIYPSWPDVEALRPDAYLVKPFPLLRLEHALAAALERRVASPAAAVAS